MESSRSETHCWAQQAQAIRLGAGRPLRPQEADPSHTCALLRPRPRSRPRPPPPVTPGGRPHVEREAAAQFQLICLKQHR